MDLRAPHTSSYPPSHHWRLFALSGVVASLVWLLAGATASPRVAGTGTIQGQVDGLGLTPHGEPGGAVVSVVGVTGDFQPLEDDPVMDQEDLRFRPHVLAVLAGTTVQFPNSDPVAHNVFSISTPKRFNLGLYHRGHKPEIHFDSAGVVTLLCNVHLEMSAHIVVLDNPYFAVVDSSGRYEIPGVPNGEYILSCWRETAPALSQRVVVRSGETVRADFPEQVRGLKEYEQVSPDN